MIISINPKTKTCQNLNRKHFVGMLRADRIQFTIEDSENEGMRIGDEFYPIDEETDLDYLKSLI